MSTAFYPLGMKTYNNYVHQGGYKSWKGTGVFSNPVGTASSHIRPLTNKDPNNNFKTGFGLPRPMKHYRKGRVIPILIADPNNPDVYINADVVNPELNRFVKSSKGSSLGGGSGGRGLLNEMLDNPGSYIVKENTITEINNVEELDKNCKTCEGVGIVATYYPNNTYLTDNPEVNTTNKKLCCNEERKAKRRVIYASTILKKNYFTTTKQYLQNRCQTYEQKAFNFQQPNPILYEQSNNYNINPLLVKPGSPLATTNTYVANCFPNFEIYDTTEIALVTKLLYILLSKNLITQAQYDTLIRLPYLSFDKVVVIINNLPEPMKSEANNIFLDYLNDPYNGVPFSGPSNSFGCKLTVYKPNNPQYAKQGAVSSSTRMLKLNVDTISSNAASLKGPTPMLIVNDLTRGANPENPFILKNKAAKCNNASLIHFQNKKSCYLDKRYNLNTAPTQPAFSSNHFAQSPVNPLMG